MTNQKDFSIKNASKPAGIGPHTWEHPDTLKAWVCRRLSVGSPCSFFEPDNCPVGLAVYRQTNMALYGPIGNFANRLLLHGFLHSCR